MPNSPASNPSTSSIRRRRTGAGARCCCPGTFIGASLRARPADRSAALFYDFAEACSGACGRAGADGRRRRGDRGVTDHRQRPRRRGRRGPGELEALVLSALREAGRPATAGWVRERLGGDLAHTTVITILTRLLAK